MTHRVLRGDIAGVALLAPVLLEGLRLPLSFNASFHDGVVYRYPPPFLVLPRFLVFFVFWGFLS